LLVVTRCTDTGYCYINFSPAFEEFVGKNLPRGLAPFDPAYIQVTEHNQLWEVKAVYIKDGVNAVLWRSAEKPAWIGKLRKEKPDATISS